MSDTENLFRPQGGRTTAQQIRDLDAPDLDLSELLASLEDLASNPDLSGAQRGQVADLIEEVTSGGNPLQDGAEAALNDGGGFLNTALNTVLPGTGLSLNRAFTALDFTGSVARSGLNQLGQGLEAAGLESGQDPAFDTNQDRLGLQGFLSGLSSGDDTVSGLDLLFDRNYQANDLTAGGLFDADTSFSTGFLGRAPVIPDRLPAPDVDTALGLGLEIATDPLTFTRAPGLLAEVGRVGTAASDVAGSLNYATRATAAASRAGRVSQVTTLANRIQRLGLDDAAAEVLEVTGKLGSAERAASEAAARRALRPVSSQIAESVTEGGLTSLIRDARKGVGGLTMEILDDLGVQRGITLGGRVIPFTEPVASALGWVRTGATARGLNRTLTRGVEGAGDLITQSAMTRFARNLAENGASPLELIEFQNMAKASKTAADGMMEGARQYMKGFFDEGSIDIGEKELREAIEGATEDAFDDLIKAGDASPFQQTMGALVDFMEENNMVVDDLVRDRVDEIIDTVDLGFDTKIFVPAAAAGLSYLQDAARRFVGEPLNGVSYRASELVADGLGNGGIINRQSATLRQFMENVATVDVFGAASRLDTLRDNLADTYFRMANAVPDEILDNFGVLSDDLARGLDELDELTGATDALFTARVEGVAPGVFEQHIVNFTRSTSALLAKGDLTEVRRVMEGFVEKMQLQTEALDNLTNDIIKEKGITEGLEAGRGYANLRRARALSDEALEGRVRAILHNEWFNPDLARPDDGLFRGRLIDPDDRALLVVANQRNPAFMQGALADLRHSIDEWTVTLAETADQFDAAFTPEIARQLKDIDTWYQAALANTTVFGQRAVDVLEGFKSDITRTRFTVEDTNAVVDKIMDINGKANVIGVGPGNWSTAMHNNSAFMNSLRRENFEEGLGRVARFVSSANRGLFKPLALFGPGFVMRNFMGQIRLNFLAGVRVTGPGGYREFLPVFDNARFALDDEVFNQLGRGGSSYWDDIPKAQRAQAQELAYSGVLTGSARGGVLDSAFELQQIAFGAADEASLLGRTRDRVRGAAESVGVELPQPGATSRRIDRIQGEFERGVSGFATAATSGRASGLNPLNVIDDGYRRDPINATQSAFRREMETYMRGALVWSNMRQGGTLADGLNAVSRNHFDYWDLTRRGQAADEFMPFWVFRSRVTTLAASMAIANPGLAAASFRLRESGQDGDPYGQGQFDGWTLGAGEASGIDWFFNPRDPLDEGFNTITSVAGAINNPSTQGVAEAAQRELIDPLAPVIGQPLNSFFQTKTGFGETQGDYLQLAATRDGLTARLAEWGANSPLGPFLSATGQIRVIDGEAYITRNGQEYLTNVVPILGRLEGLLVEQLAADGEEMSQTEIDKKVLNTFYSFTGIPFTGITNKNRQGVINAQAYDVDYYDKLISQQSALGDGEESAPSQNLFAPGG